MLRVGFSQYGQGVISALKRLEEMGSLSRTLRTDNGPEFTSKALKIWADERGIVINHTRSGKPTDKVYIESFNGSLREECLNQHIFTSIWDAKEKIELWRQDYNEVRSHWSLGWLTQAAYRKKNSKQQSEAYL